MKKLFFAIALIFTVSLAVNAQPRAIGGRVGSGVEVSYQHLLSDNMINLQVGFPYISGIGVEAVATYDWIFPISSWKEQGSWNWYAGVGAGAGLWGFSNPTGFVGVAGRIGVEYNFWFPMQLSIDWSPVVGPYFSGDGIGFSTGSLSGFGLGVRYIF